MRLAPKLALFLLVVLVLVLGADAWVGIWRETDVIENDMRRDQLDVGQALSAAIAAVWRVDGRERALEVVVGSNRKASHTRVRWVTPAATDGDPEAPHLHGAAARITNGETFAGIDRAIERFGRLYTYVPVQVNGRLEGALEISESFDEERGYIRSLVAERLITVLFVAILFGVTTAVLGNYLVLRPMSALIEKARRVGSGDFAHPLRLRQHDEIGALGREIDAMCDQLAAAHDRIATETTARISALEQLRHADRLATVGQLAAGVAHELGTPLNVVSQRARMIAVGEVTGADAVEGARIVFEQSQRITGVIRQLLDFARRRTPEKSPQDLAACVQQTATFLAPLAQKRSVRIGFDCDGGPWTADVDAGQLQQVLANLMVNGIQAMPEGGALGVALRRRRVQPPADCGGPVAEYYAIEVSDEGSGIPNEHLSRLFEPFFTTKDVGEGTGLGLAVAYGIVREHGGWIEADSVMGRGSRFTVYLPLGASA